MQVCVQIGLLMDRCVAKLFDGTSVEGATFQVEAQRVDIANPQHRERLGVSYWSGGQALASQHRQEWHSYTFDATPVGKNDLLACAITFPFNAGCWLLPQAL